MEWGKATRKISKPSCAERRRISSLSFSGYFKNRDRRSVSEAPCRECVRRAADESPGAISCAHTRFLRPILPPTERLQNNRHSIDAPPQQNLQPSAIRRRENRAAPPDSRYNAN